MAVTVFEYPVLISINLYDFISTFSAKFLFWLRRYIKETLDHISKNFEVRQNTPAGVVFSNLFSLCDVIKHGLSGLIYYFKALKPQRVLVVGRG